MKTGPFNPALLPESVFAVPPLARDSDYQIDADENEKIIRYLEAGGVRSLLYGGNAVLYHTSLADFDNLLAMLSDSAGPDTTVVPSIGPSYGIASDQIGILQEFDFGTAMLLPSRDIVDSAGIATGIRMLAEQYGKPLVVYLKHDRWLEPQDIQSLEADGAISWIKYAVVRENPAEDNYLREITDVFPAERIVSGIGEQPAIVHLRDFGITGFTSGCVCVSPRKSMDMLGAIQSDDIEMAESIRQYFRPLEDLRDGIHPIRVLHEAVRLAGVAETGPIQPMLSNVCEETQAKIREALKTMKLVD
ncbi:dihydrodipicolinate synthase family protein [Rhodopirellula sp. JC740]|uniref:Dihydrodipicolinate synthase family protein n=1 Tax=Rhodopirellula halodulae TaxID=2894198 RepID=A0ABS8NFH0_9BACT|nr:dihydrodipicolinate synthase family protein [Rhodopirellula sp. JC740]MCC9642305.1 dihydrodipicolinate synthase family protein [Rhodopirellula sp. JC740]